MSDLVVSGVSKSFGRHSVLAGIGLRVASGSLVALLGASGSGKTTLLRLICGFERLDAGAISLDGRMIAEPGLHMPPERRRIGYVAQDGALFPHLDIAANIAFGLPRSERGSTQTVTRLLATVGLPASYATRQPHELSGGEQQRVALARALAPKPRIVLLDEPFSSLDAALRTETRTAVADALAASGATALLVTHDQAEALSMGRQVAVLRDGRMIQIAAPDVLYRRPVDAAMARFLGEAVLLPGAAQNGHVDCALGRLALASGMPSGLVDVMIRPEQIRLAAPGADLLSAVVANVTFYGHDATVTLTIAGIADDCIRARIAGHRVPQAGERVSVEIDGEVVAFARRDAGSATARAEQTIDNRTIEHQRETVATA